MCAPISNLTIPWPVYAAGALYALLYLAIITENNNLTFPIGRRVSAWANQHF